MASLTNTDNGVMSYKENDVMGVVGVCQGKSL